MPNPDDPDRKVLVRIATLETRVRDFRELDIPKRIGELEMKMAVIQVKLAGLVFIVALVATVIGNIIGKKFG